MNVKDAQSRIKARIWQNIAKSGEQFSMVPHDTMETLVNLATDAALMELDDGLGDVIEGYKESMAIAPAGEEGEKTLWEGRPFLSIGTQYIITSERVRVIEGVLGKDREDIELIRIQDIDQKQTLRERMFNLGDITIRSHDDSKPKIKFNNVRDPETVHEILRRAVLSARKQYGLAYREEM
ncbi:MAG: PH domain-containing protein [Ardenticatenaceae bacterium]|nr:PH domain-containing protein [Ardenticatenaceae bacterium]